ncbi:hypothetical protein HHK36_024141 [Tetracentron sinense]|uniref:SET domain-containing protein n=1 Tax=Tetracentron sinense TaxID=13715 RepID=A0A834YJQ0_TETSI|nr:hypothetical protein HHK36_024141 [Tetracentron sinense]
MIIKSILTWMSGLRFWDRVPRDAMVVVKSIPHLEEGTPHLCAGAEMFVFEFGPADHRSLEERRKDWWYEWVGFGVPKSALMTRETLLKDRELSDAIKRHPFLSSTQILSSCLLAEMSKGKGSWWHPYLIQLPRNYDTLTSFTRFEARALQVDDAIWAAEKAISKAELDWKEARPLMQELKLKPQLLTFRSWLWSSATISSRTLHIPWDDAGCLCPVGDFFNYAAPGEEFLCSEDVEKLDARQSDDHIQRLTDGGYEENVAAYCFYARKRYKKGEQVLLSYGTYTNLELLEHYGFLLNANPNNKVFLSLEPDIHSTSSWPKDSLYIEQDGKPSFALVSALRLWATPPNKRKSIGHLAYSGSQLSAENEISVMRWTANNCRLILEKLPTAIEDDTLLLQAIEKMQDHLSPKEVEQLLLAFGDEFGAFFEANGLLKGESGVEFPLCRKIRRSMDRWKLAVQWRLRYKKILCDCVSYSNMIIWGKSIGPITIKL